MSKTSIMNEIQAFRKNEETFCNLCAYLFLCENKSNNCCSLLHKRLCRELIKDLCNEGNIISYKYKGTIFDYHAFIINWYEEIKAKCVDEGYQDLAKNFAISEELSTVYDDMNRILNFARIINTKDSKDCFNIIKYMRANEIIEILLSDIDINVRVEMLRDAVIYQPLIFIRDWYFLNSSLNKEQCANKATELRIAAHNYNIDTSDIIIENRKLEEFNINRLQSVFEELGFNVIDHTKKKNFLKKDRFNLVSESFDNISSPSVVVDSDLILHLVNLVNDLKYSKSNKEIEIIRRNIYSRIISKSTKTSQCSNYVKLATEFINLTNNVNDSLRIKQYVKNDN